MTAGELPPKDNPGTPDGRESRPEHPRPARASRAKDVRERLKAFAGGLNFTPTERLVVLTLSGALLAGLAVRLFFDEPPAGPVFDYSARDAEFARLSSAPSPSRAGEDRGDTSPASRRRGSRAKKTPARVELNGATKSELMQLPGVGAVLAERILIYRSSVRRFRSVDELLNVKGIGKKKLGQIAPYCFVEK